MVTEGSGAVELRLGVIAGALALLALLAVPTAGAEAAEVAAHMPATHASGASVSDGTRYVYVFGGYHAGALSDDIVRYDTLTQTTTVLAASLPQAVAGAAAVWDPSSQSALVFGGSTGAACAAHSNATLRFTPATGTLTTLNNALPPLTNHAAVRDPNTGHVYLFGGMDSSCVISSAIYRYNASINTITPLRSALPSGRQDPSAVWSTTQNAAFIFGGQTSSGSTSEIVRFYPGNGTVSAIGSLPSSRYRTSATTSDSFAYVFGGSTSPTTRLDEVVRVNLVTATSTVSSAHLPSARSATSAALINGIAYVVGGYAPTATDQIVAYDPTAACATWDNDCFADAIALSSPTGTGVVTQKFGLETGERRPCGAIGSTAWYGFTAVTNGTLHVDTIGSNYDTVLALYSGPSRLALSYLACNDDINGEFNRQSTLNAACTAGTQYWVQLGGWNHASGTALLNLTGCGPSVPSAPTALSATPSNARVNLSWSAPASNGGSAITGYNIYRGTTSGGETLYRTLGNFLTFADTNVTNGVAYYYKVSASNAAGAGALSGEASATPRTIPGAPQSPVATGGNALVSVSWTPPASNGGSAITGYKLHRGTTSGGESLYRTLGNALSFADANVTNGVAYYYKISAINVAGDGPLSAETNATPRTVPDAPTGLTATPSNGRVNLTWTAPISNGGSPIASYKIYRGTTSGGETLYRTLGVTFAFADTNVTNGVTYYYKTSATNAAGEGALSAEASGTPRTPPTAPQSLAATPSATRVDLSWAPPAWDGGATINSYNVYRNASSGVLVFYRNVPPVPSFADVNVSNGVTYTYLVSASNAAGNGPFSNEASATPRTMPGAPTLTSATPGVWKITVNWTPPADNGGAVVTGYVVHRAAGLASGPIFYRSVGNVASFVDTNITEGTSYSYQVNAVNVAGEGPKSGTLAATAWALPGAPTSLVATNAVGRINLTWSAPGNGGTPITSYTVYRGTSNGSLVGHVTIPSGTSYSDTSGVGGTRYHYAVSATNAMGEGARSGTVDKVFYFAPTQANNFVAAAGPSAHTVSLSWTPPSSTGGATPITYELARWENGTYQVLTTTSALGYVDANRPNSVQQYRLVAINGVGFRSSDGIRTVTPWTYPSAPRAFDAAPTPTEGSILLTWDRPANEGGGARVVVGYRVEARIDGGNWTTLATLGDQGAYLTDMARGSGVHFRVKAINDKGEVGAASETDFAAPIYFQNDPSDFGDASNEIGNPTPFFPGALGSNRAGFLAPGADDLDAYKIEVQANNGNGTATYCHWIDPTDDLDVAVRMLGPGFDHTVDEEPAGGSESVCHTGTPGTWTVVVSVVATPKSESGPRIVDTFVPFDPTPDIVIPLALAPAAAGSYTQTCTPWPECTLLGDTDAAERPMCGGCSDPLSTIRDVFRTLTTRLSSTSHNTEYYGAHKVATDRLEQMEATALR